MYYHYAQDHKFTRDHWYSYKILSKYKMYYIFTNISVMLNYIIVISK